MRRLLAITLLLAFGVPMLSALLGSRPGEASGLPACCKKGGMHHCSGMLPSSDGSPVVAAVPCSQFPPAATAVRVGGAASPVLRRNAAGLLAASQLIENSDRDVLICERCAAHPKRGPPQAIA